MNDLDTRMTQRIHELSRMTTSDVSPAVQELSCYWQEAVANIAGSIHEKCNEQLEEVHGGNTLDEAAELEASAATRGAHGACASSLPLAAQRWIYIFMGRMLHALKLYDDWQIIPFLKGRGGSPPPSLSPRSTPRRPAPRVLPPRGVHLSAPPPPPRALLPPRPFRAPRQRKEHHCTNRKELLRS